MPRQYCDLSRPAVRYILSGYASQNRIAGVPEPASWAMMIGGLAMAGGVMRRRQLAVRFG